MLFKIKILFEYVWWFTIFGHICLILKCLGQIQTVSMYWQLELLHIVQKYSIGLLYYWFELSWFELSYWLSVWITLYATIKWSSSNDSSQNFSKPWRTLKKTFEGFGSPRPPHPKGPRPHHVSPQQSGNSGSGFVPHTIAIFPFPFFLPVLNIFRTFIVFLYCWFYYFLLILGYSWTEVF